MKTKTIEQIGLVTALVLMLMTFRLEAQDKPSKVKEYGIGLSDFNSFSLQYRWGNEQRLFRISGSIGGTTGSGNSANNSSALQDTSHYRSLDNMKTTSPINLSCGLRFSVLKIKPVSEKFGIMYGGIFGFVYFIKQSTATTITDKNGTYIYSGGNGYYSYNNYTSTTISEQNIQTIQPYIGIALGAVYKITPSFLLYAEIDPNLYYAYTKSTVNISATESNITTTSNYQQSSNTFGLENLSNSGASLTIVYRITK